MTGYELVRLPEKGIWKVYDTTYDPMSSKPHSADREDWSRWDLDDENTSYGATERRGGFAEVLAPLRPRLKMLNLLARSELTAGMEDFKGIESELVARGMVTGWIPAGWRFNHGVAQIDASQREWFVDVDSISTINALRESATAEILQLGYDDLDVSHIRSLDRGLTLALAEVIAWEVLDDGSSPAGIRFVSRHGSDYECWAIWDRAHPVLVEATGGIAKGDSDYCFIVNAFGLQTR